MKHPDTLIRYVEEPGRSANFFHALFSAPIVQQSPNFAVLALPNLTLGLWARHDVQPTPASGVAGFELTITLDSRVAVDLALAEAQSLGLEVAQGPTEKDFGYTFAVLSPDGYTIRAFYPSEQ